MSVSNNKVLKNFSYLSLVQILNYALPLITIPIVSRALGVEMIGLVNYILAYVVFFVLLVSYSFSLTAMRKIAKEEKLNYIFSIVFKSQLLLFVLSSFLFFLGLFIIPDLANNQVLSFVLYLSVLAAIFDKTWVFQYKQDLSVVAIINVIFKLITTIIIFLFVNKQNDYLIYALALNGSVFLSNIGLFIVCLIKYNIKIIKVELNEVFCFLKEGKTLFFSSFVISLYTATSTLLLGLYCSNYDVGLYTAATRIVEIAKVFAITPITQLIYPLVAQKFSQDVEQGILYIKNLMPIFILLSFILLVGMVIFGPLAIYILYGEKFIDAIPILWILSLTLVLILFSTVFGILVMVNLGMDDLFFKNQLYVAAASIILTISVLPYGGGITSAMILVISEIMIMSYQYYILKSKGYIFFNLEIFSKKAFINAIQTLKTH